MKVNGKRTAAADLLLAVLVNLIFLLVILSVYSPYFETNDDFVLMQMSNGAYGSNEYRLVFLNIFLGGLISLLYSMIPGFQWYTIVQCFMLLCSFTGICWVLLRRWRVCPALAATLSMLLFFALDAYVCIQFTKTASVLVCAGLFVMYHALEEENKRRWIMAAGGALALVGLMYRALSFFSCGFICCFVVLDMLLTRLPEAKKRGENIFTVGLKLLLPFFCLVSFALLLVVADKIAYREEAWSDYMSFNVARSDVMDYGVLPDYEKVREVCEEKGINESLFSLIKNWEFIEPDVLFEGGGMHALAEYCNELRARRETALFQSTFSHLMEMLHYWPSLGLLSAGLVWLLFGRHEKRVWLSMVLAGLGVLLNICALGLIGRYMYRVDYGLLFAMFTVVLWFTPRADNNKKTALAAASVSVLAALIMSLVYLPGWNGKFMKGAEARYPERAELVSEIKNYDALIITDTSYFDCYMHDSPFSVHPDVTAENILPLGGWQAMYPPLMEQYAAYGVRNPFRDCVDREDVMFLTNHIELTLGHIRETYCPTAEAEMLIPPTDALRYGLYKIVS